MALITNVSDYEELAKQKLSKMVYDFYAAGAEDQQTLKENKEAFSRILFRPRVLIDVSRIDMSMSVLGYNISMPIMVAPTALHKLAHPEGEVASARATAAAGTIMMLSSWPSSSIEEVNSSGPGLRFFQLSVFKDRNFVQQLVKRAENVGYKAIAVTVDAPRLGRREADVRNRFSLPENVVLKCFEGLDLSNLDKKNFSGLAAYVTSQIDSSLSWKDIKWLQTITRLPILVKGVLTAEDAQIAIKCGVAGIIISNHGGRQLDYLPATISCLEEVVLQPDRFLSDLTSMYERSTEKGSVWVTMKRSSLKGKAQLQKMERKGKEIEYRCLIRASDGKKSISTSVSLKEYAKFQASYATVLKAHMHALKKRERKDRKKAADAEKVPETTPKKQKKKSSKKSSGSKS